MRNQLSHLLKYDFLLLQRNNVITASIVITGIYIGVFQALSSLPNAQKLLVLILFVDPVILGFLFIGVMVLFETSENTLQALSVSPIKLQMYLFSKSIALSLMAVFCCILMIIAAYGLDFNILHFLFASTLTAVMLSFIGFIAVAGETSINRFILRVLAVVLFLSIPFFGYFGVVSNYWFVLFPSTPALALFDLSFSESTRFVDLLWPYLGTTFWVILAYFLARMRIVKSFVL